MTAPKPGLFDGAQDERMSAMVISEARRLNP